jgi:hypothetical protein
MMLRHAMAHPDGPPRWISSDGARTNQVTRGRRGDGPTCDADSAARVCGGFTGAHTAQEGRKGQRGARYSLYHGVGTCHRRKPPEVGELHAEIAGRMAHG